jgi:hypothetical protein
MFSTDDSSNFPIPNAMVDAVQIVVTMYPIVLRHRGPREVAPAPGGTKQFNIPALVSASVGLTVLAYTIMYAVKVALNIMLPQKLTYCVAKNKRLQVREYWFS